MQLAQAFLNCYQLAQPILNRFFALEIDKNKYPYLFKERERLKQKITDPNYSHSEGNNHQNVDKLYQEIQRINRDFDHLSQKKGISHLSLSLINAAADVFQVQTNIETIKKSKISTATGDFFLLTQDQTHQLAEPIRNLSDTIHHFVYEILSQCGGNKGVMYDLQQLFKAKSVDESIT